VKDHSPVVFVQNYNKCLCSATDKLAFSQVLEFFLLCIQVSIQITYFAQPYAGVRISLNVWSFRRLLQ